MNIWHGVSPTADFLVDIIFIIIIHRRRRHRAGGGTCPLPNFWQRGHGGAQQNLWGTFKKLKRLMKKPNIQRVIHWQRTRHCHSSTALSITLCFMSAQTAVRHRFSSSTSCIAVS